MWLIFQCLKVRRSTEKATLAMCKAIALVRLESVFWRRPYSAMTLKLQRKLISSTEHDHRLCPSHYQAFVMRLPRVTALPSLSWCARLIIAYGVSKQRFSQSFCTEPCSAGFALLALHVDEVVLWGSLWSLEVENRELRGFARLGGWFRHGLGPECE